MSVRFLRNVACNAVLAGIACFGAMASNSRADLIFEFYPPAFNGSTPSGSETLPSPFLRETFTQTGVNTVQLTIDVLWGPALPEFVDTIRFNSSVASLTFTHVSGVTASSTATGTFGASGGYGNIPGNFNVEFDYPSPAAQRLNGTNNQSVYSITGTGLTEASFLVLSSGGTTPMYTAAHIAGFGQAQSGAFQGRLVPEPSSIALCAIAGCIGFLKRKSFRRVIA